MIESILGASGASVVIIAPHPDDESIATGGLIQVALVLGARVTVVLLTDGDNNPWPQRAIERRLWIGTGERERWGRRRLQEARSALAILGVPETSIYHVGLPDLGVTNRLVSDTSATVGILCELFRDAAPTLVVAPSLSDRHPDHNAAHVMCSLALAASRSSARFLSYTVHGTTDGASVECVLDSRRRKQKSRAIAEYHTQLVLSRKRITAYAARSERFVIESAASGRLIPPVWRLPWRTSRLSAAFADVILVADKRSWRVAIESAKSVARDGGFPRCVRDAKGQLSMWVPAQLGVSLPAFTKLQGRPASPWIYDRWGWARPGR